MRMHVDQYMHITDLELVRNLLLVTAELTVDFIESELQSGADADESLFQRARSAFKRLPTARNMIEQRRKVFMRAEPRYLSTDAAERRTHVRQSATGGVARCGGEGWWIGT